MKRKATIFIKDSSNCIIPVYLYNFNNCYK